MSKRNALTVDVEDYFQVSAFENSIRRENWESLEHRVENNVNRLLELFDDADVKATFFVLGWVAERYPAIVDKIVGLGHELASHGFSHKRVSDMNHKEFSQDVVKAKSILEDLSGVEVKGYRAPSYSISESNNWALSVLKETGHVYSSSIYPVHHDHYGYPSAPRFVFRDQKTGLIEIPISTFQAFNRLFPAGGGGFFRFYPYRLSKWAIYRINKYEKQSALFYLHPWEIDPGQPKQKNISQKTRFRHYLNLHKTEARLKCLLNDFDWGRMDDVFIKEKGISTFPLT